MASPPVPPTVRRTLTVAVAAAILWSTWTAPLAAQQNQFRSLRKLNRQIRGEMLDFTHNHGRDARFQSQALCGPRDIYVYLPPGYCADRTYPLLVWMHGAFGDEHAFFPKSQLPYLESLICRGCFPPTVIVCIDGCCSGRNFVLAKHSFYLNGCCGRFQDHVMREVIPWAAEKFNIAPDRRARALIGTSAGGLGAMNTAIKYQDCFGHVVSISGAINLRYYNCQQDYSADFNPATYRPRTTWDPDEIAGRLGPLNIRASMFIEPVFGSDPEQIIRNVTRENPVDLMQRCLKPGQLNMLVAYGGADQLNFDAQGASFAWLARQQGHHVDEFCLPEGKHDGDFFLPAIRRAYRWLGAKLHADAAVVHAEPAGQ